MSSSTTADSPTNTVTLTGPSLENEIHDVYTTDFGFIPIPKSLRYNPDKPFHFGLLMNAAFGFASTFGEHLCKLRKFSLD